MRYVTVVRGRLKSGDGQDSRAVHNAILEQLPTVGRPLGAIGHQAYLDPSDPTAFLAIDTWTNLEGLQQFMGDAAVGEAFGNLFDGTPQVSIWAEADGWTSFHDE